MSDAPDQPVVEAAPAAPAPGVEAAAPATTETTNEDDIDTDAFDRMEAPDEDEDAGAGDGQPSGETSEGKPTAAAEPDADTVEVERNGQKFKIPKALEAELMMDADYRRKTQTLAEDRRALDAERAQQADSLAKFRDEHFAIATRERELTAINGDLAEYAKLTDADWQAIKAQDAKVYDAHVANFTDLQRRRGMANDALESAKTDLATKETSLTETRKAADEAKLNESWKQANVTIKAAIPDWGAAKFNEIGNFVNKEFGVTPEQLKTATDPNAWIIANRLMRAEARVKTLEAAGKQQVAAANTAKAAEVVPAAKPAGASPAPRGVTDGLATKDWMKRRNAQLAKKG